MAECGLVMEGESVLGECSSQGLGGAGVHTFGIPALPLLVCAVMASGAEQEHQGCSTQL